MFVESGSVGVTTYLCFSGFALMARNTNLIKQAMQLTNTIVHLLGEITSVHNHESQSPQGRRILRRRRSGLCIGAFKTGEVDNVVRK